jgi:hypothetical protein
MKTRILASIMSLIICAVVINVNACVPKDNAEFAIETLSMTIGYELRDSFEWTPEVDAYYQAIQEGKLSIDAAKTAEDYLRTVTHPLIANRLVKLAAMAGFDFDAYGHLIGIDKVDMGLLKIAALGFRTGLTLGGASEIKAADYPIEPVDDLMKSGVTFP